MRTREHLTEREVERLIEAAKTNRNGHRDATMVLLAYRHGEKLPKIASVPTSYSTLVRNPQANPYEKLPIDDLLAWAGLSGSPVN